MQTSGKLEVLVAESVDSKTQNQTVLGPAIALKITTPTEVESSDSDDEASVSDSNLDEQTPLAQSIRNFLAKDIVSYFRVKAKQLAIDKKSEGYLDYNRDNQSAVVPCVIANDLDSLIKSHEKTVNKILDIRPEDKDPLDYKFLKSGFNDSITAKHFVVRKNYLRSKYGSRLPPPTLSAVVNPDVLRDNLIKHHSSQGQAETPSIYSTTMSMNDLGTPAGKTPSVYSTTMRMSDLKTPAAVTPCFSSTIKPSDWEETPPAAPRAKKSTRTSYQSVDDEKIETVNVVHPSFKRRSSFPGFFPKKVKSYSNGWCEEPVNAIFLIGELLILKYKRYFELRNLNVTEFSLILKSEKLNTEVLELFYQYAESVKQNLQEKMVSRDVVMMVLDYFFKKDAKDILAIHQAANQLRSFS